MILIEVSRLNIFAHELSAMCVCVSYRDDSFVSVKAHKCKITLWPPSGGIYDNENRLFPWEWLGF
jgi:hypothetical protein